MDVCKQCGDLGYVILAEYGEPKGRIPCPACSAKRAEAAYAAVFVGVYTAERNRNASEYAAQRAAQEAVRGFNYVMNDIRSGQCAR